MKTSEVLNRAADLIEERGWRRGGGWPGGEGADRGLCLEGGIMAALGLSFYEADMDEFAACPAYRAVRDFLDSVTFWLWKWNDASGRTAAEVIEVLRATALIEAARESKVEVSA